MNDQGSSFLESVLHSQSIQEIEKLSPYAVELANRWAKEAPSRTRELEASGKLVATLKERAENEALLQWRTRIRAVRGQKEAAPTP